MNVLLTTLNAKYTHSSLALRYLREFCRSLPCEMIVKEFSINQQVLEILGQIYEEKPTVVGFSCSIWNIELTLQLARLLKKILPQTVIICGGPEVSYEAEAFLAQHAQVDYLVAGEGEQTLYRLLEKLTRGEKVTAASGLSYREATTGEIICGGAAVVERLDDIPFPYREDEMEGLADKILYYETSRGCPFSCQYCLSSATRGVRFFSTSRVLEELRFFIRHDVRQVKFVDRTFNAKKSHYLDIWRFLAQLDACRTNFHFEIAAELLDEEALQVLARMPMGRIQLEIGVQSTNSRTLQSICRAGDFEKIARNVAALLVLGTMHVHLDLIIGLPEEDYASFGRSFNDVYRLQPHMLQLGFLKLLKGSGIAENAASYAYVFMDKAPYEVLANRFISYEEIRALQIFEEVFEQYYNSGRFRHATAYLVAAAEEDAFRFYEALARYWQTHNLHLVAHATKSLYQHLYDFCRAIFPQEVPTVCQLLKLDALCADQGRIRPNFLPWSKADFYEETSEFWRGAAVTKYLPAYQFTNWRELKKSNHIEIFNFSVETWRNTGKFQSAQEAVLFHYTEGAVRYQTIDAQDFSGKGVK